MHSHRRVQRFNFVSSDVGACFEDYVEIHLRLSLSFGKGLKMTTEILKCRLHHLSLARKQTVPIMAVPIPNPHHLRLFVMSEACMWRLANRLVHDFHLSCRQSSLVKAALLSRSEGACRRAQKHQRAEARCLYGR